MAKLNDLIVTGDAKFLGKLHANADTATTASSVFDAGDNSILTLNRSATALSNPTYLAGWDGNVLKAVNRSNLSVNYANSSGAISALTENDKASSSDVQRRVWFAYSNNTTGRPAYDDAFTYQTSTGTLTAKIFKGALSGTSDRSKYLETWKADKSQGTYGTQYPLYAWWESNNVCKLVVDSYSTKVDTANTAAALTSNAGSAGQAIYFANGVPVALDWRMGNKDVGEHNCDNVTYNFSGYYTSNGPTTTLGASTTDGSLWSQAYNSTWVTQIAQDYRNGNLFVRGKNNGTWQSWKAVLTSPNKPMVFHWTGLAGQPTWLWGGTDGTNMYVYNPSNFSVNYANSAGDANTLDGIDSTGFLRYYNANSAITSTDVVNTPSYVHTVSTTGGNVTTATKPSGMDNAWGIIHLHTHVGNYATQLGFGGTTGNMYFRNAYNADTFEAWKTLLDSSNYTSFLDGRYVNTSGDTMSGTLNMDNHSITGIGELSFADPGANEGITWAGGNGWWIYESPDNLTNDKGNLQFVQGSTRRLTMRTDGVVDIPSGVMTPYINMTPYSVGDGKAKNWYRIWTGVHSNAGGHSYCIFTISRSYNSPQNESYTFAVTVGYNGDINITQLSGVKGTPQIPKIRVVYKNSGKVYIDFYGNANATYENTYYVSGFGYGKFQTPTVTSATVESGYTAYEFTTTGGMKTSGFLSVGGSTSSSYALATPSFICDSWIRTKGATGWCNETYSGGIYMTDTTYVRVYNDKQFYVSNSGQHAIYTAGGFASAQTNGPVLSTYYNNTWYGDTIQTHGNGNLSISAPGGNLYLAYARGVTYFGGGTYCIDRSGYFNGTSAAAYYLPTSITFADVSSPWTPATIYSSIGSGGRIKKGSWDYAGNGYVAKGNVTNGSKCPFFAIDLAGTTVIQAANSSSVYTQIYITSPTTSGVTGAATNEMVFYNYHGDDYSPAWTRVLTNRNYNSYAPTLTGTGASGTWGISITGNAATATLPLGFTSRNDNATWGNQTGTTVTCWNEVNGGSVDWRRDNPSSGKISLKVDGRFYGNEGNNPAMLLTTDGNYWGMGSPDGDASVWIRTTSQGIIPYASKSAGSGTCYLGTSTWYFGYAYIDNIYGSSFSGNAATATKATKDGNGDTISSTYLKLSGGTMTGNITLGTYGMLGFGNTIPATHKEVTSFTPEANAVWLVTTGGGTESSGICLDGASIKFWTPNDSVIEFLDSDVAAGTNYASVKFGTVTGGTWNGSTIGVAYGGTGVTSWTANRVLYASAATTLSTTSHYVSSTKMAINSTTEPSYNFYVSGSSRFYGAVTITGTLTLTKTTDASATANNSPALIIGGAATAAHIEIDNNEIIAKSNGTTQTVLYIQDTGGVTTFGGRVNAPSFNATSDMRLKTNLRSFKHGDIFDLPVYKFDFIVGETNKIGCMAQDLQQICPEIVHQDEDGYLNIEESKIVYLLLDKMKEMQAEINALKEVLM